MATVLFLDADGYAASGVPQTYPATPESDGFRVRELGWTCASRAGTLMVGAEYFYDPPSLAPLDSRQPSIRHAFRLCALPVAPTARSFDGRARPSTELYEAIREVVERTRPDTVAHKGGHEGRWVRRALGERCPALLDLNALGCPRLSASMAELLTRCEREVMKPCPYHATTHAASRATTHEVLHCPRYECGLMFAWWREHAPRRAP